MIAISKIPTHYKPPFLFRLQSYSQFPNFPNVSRKFILILFKIQVLQAHPEAARLQKLHTTTHTYK